MNLDNYDWGFSALCSTVNGTNGIRTPLTISDRIKQDISGKVFCDLGCGEGDFALCCERYASQVIGVELVPERAEVARMKGLNVITGDILLKLPEADVYYCWVGVKVRQLYDMIPVGKMIIFGFGDPLDLKPWLEGLPGVIHETMEYVREGIKMTFNIYKVKKEN
jgi:SAM-dependent methyltransferase